jgi:hypothetical protein
MADLPKNDRCLWSILILTMPQRAALLGRLLEVLRPQIEAPKVPKVELLIRESDPALPVGENREALRQQSRGQYISFIDDDDLVPPHFVERILPCLDGVDYVAFNLEQRMDGHFLCVEKRSLGYGRVGREEAGRDGRDGRFRDISHLNPMRRELALRVPMTGWPCEDNRWADALRELHIVRTEHLLDETLYYYLTRSRKPEYASATFLVSVGSEPFPWSLMPKIKVKMLTSIAGLANPDYDLPEHGYQQEEIVELHPVLANAWIEAGIAEAFKEKDPKAGRAGHVPSKVEVMPKAEESSPAAKSYHFPPSNEGEKQEVAAAEPLAEPAAADASTASASSSSSVSGTGDSAEKPASRSRRSTANPNS